MAQLPKGRRILGGTRAELAATLKAKYERGVSIRTLAAETGRSFGFVHTLLGEAGATMRQRGGSRPRASTRRG